MGTNLSRGRDAGDTQRSRPRKNAAAAGDRPAVPAIVLAEHRACADTADDAILRIERSLDVIDRFGRAHRLDAATRTALRIRTMMLVDRLEIEQARLRFAEGNFAAARYHLSAARERPFTRRLALLALRVAPRLARVAYLRLGPWRSRLAGALVP